MMYIRYRGRRHQLAYYDCMGAVQEGRRGCLSVGARNVDGAVSQALLSALRPTPLQAAFDAFEQGTQQDSRKLKALELALQQARYETQRARRQYDAVEPENRLVCGELEKRWEHALGAERQAEQVWEQARTQAKQLSQEDRLRLAALAEDLPHVWSHEATSMELKKRLVRCALTSITAELVDDPPRVNLLLHWPGGVHTDVQVERNRTGEHSRCADREQLQVSQCPVRKLRQRGLLEGRQIVKYAPWMISPDALRNPMVPAAVAKVHAGLSVPSAKQEPELPLQLTTDEG